jgi:hypothetical protein
MALALQDALKRPPVEILVVNDENMICRHERSPPSGGGAVEG